MRPPISTYPSIWRVDCPPNMYSKRFGATLQHESTTCHFKCRALEDPFEFLEERSLLVLPEDRRTHTHVYPPTRRDLSSKGLIGEISPLLESASIGRSMVTLTRSNTRVPLPSTCPIDPSRQGHHHEAPTSITTPELMFLYEGVRGT